MKSRNLTVCDCLHLTRSQEPKVLVNKHKSDSVKTLRHLYSRLRPSVVLLLLLEIYYSQYLARKERIRFISV